MLSSELLEKLADLAKIVRNNQRPFGGIQLLFVGDFLQVMLAWRFTLVATLSFFLSESTYLSLMSGVSLSYAKQDI